MPNGNQISIKRYAELDPLTKRNLLLGNGFSKGVCDGFGYESLVQVARDRDLVSAEEAQLFQEVGAKDFEHVLATLRSASTVNRVLRIDDCQTEPSYARLRDALIGSVEHVHPDYHAVDYAWMVRAAAELRSFERVFTTNYDLVPYWVLGSVGFEGFVDFFWSGDRTFNPANVKLHSDVRPVHYLHGALFLFREGPTLRKLVIGTGEDLLQQVRAEIQADRIPAFVSEGQAQDKLRAIRQDLYLSHCWESFQATAGGITLFDTVQ